MGLDLSFSSLEGFLIPTYLIIISKQIIFANVHNIF